ERFLGKEEVAGSIPALGSGKPFLSSLAALLRGLTQMKKSCKLTENPAWEELLSSGLPRNQL
ncbi:MAG TPA: hypothetical protein VMV23_07330, partial [Candidatus Nanopelagicaceae bacterium]|nr:hypothetical protein [Candidatus Nanopelagicaceae bacterium]